MSSREKRNVVQPSSYKDFAEKGVCHDSETEEILDYIDTVPLTQTDEEIEPAEEERLLAGACGGAPKVPAPVQQTPDAGGKNSETDNEKVISNGTDDAVNLHVSPEEDTFKDNTKKASPKKKKKSKQNSLPPPKFPTRPPPFADDGNYQTELAIVEKEREAARQMLLHSEREAKLMEDKLKAEEDRKKARQLQQKAKKTEKKVIQQKERYEKELQKQRADHDHDSWVNTPVREPIIDDYLFIDDNTGPQNIKDKHTNNIDFIPIDKNEKQTYVDIARELINDENVSICRETGIYRGRHSREVSPMDRRPPRVPSRGSQRSRTSRDSHHRNTRPISHDRRSDSDVRHSSREQRGGSRGRGRRSRYDKEQPWNIDEHRSSSPSRRRQRSGELEHSWFTNSDSSSSQDELRKKSVRRNVKKKSGINAKPCSKVKQELTYPHFSLGQTSTFIGTAISFHNLTYEQFMAGELCTIMSTTSYDERKGRIKLLHKISQWKLFNAVQWPQIRNTYAMILRLIENQQTSWNTNFDRFERHIYERVFTKNEKYTKKNTDWFCKAFQKVEGCPKDCRSFLRRLLAQRQN